MHLERINRDFYPTALLAPSRVAERTWHFERRTDGFLCRKEFASFYDRLGKYLHADNPWGPSKEVQNLAADLPASIAKLRALLEWHMTVIRSPEFNGVWVIEVPWNGSPARVITGLADGDFVMG